MRPDGGGSTAVRLSLSGVIHEHQVHIAVAVIVIPGEVDFVVEFLTGVDDRLLGTHIVSLIVVPPVIGIGGVQLDRPVNIEDRLEEAVRIVVVVIQGGTGPAVHGVPLLVQQVVESGMGILAGGELHVREFDQDHQEVFLAQGNGLGRAPRSPPLPGGGAPGGGIPADPVHGEVAVGPVETVRRFGDQAAEGIRGPVTEFVAVALDDDLGSVRLGIDDPTGIGGDGGHQLVTGQQRDERKDEILFHGRYFLRMRPWPEPFPSHTFGPSSLTTVRVNSLFRRTALPLRYRTETFAVWPLARDGS